MSDDVTMTHEPVELGTAEQENLIRRLTQQNYSDYAATTQRLLDTVQQQLRERDAELNIVRERLEEICYGPWAPNGQAVIAALLVTRAEMKAWLDEHPEPQR